MPAGSLFVLVFSIVVNIPEKKILDNHFLFVIIVLLFLILVTRKEGF